MRVSEESMAITLSQRAAQRVKQFLEQRGKGIGLRLGVKTTGCSGLGYLLEFVDQLKDDDQIFETQGIKVIVNEKSLVYLQGMALDFVKEGLNEGFKFDNPNTKGSCGCGESFHV
jgi:iron-sulfur cluster assembly protein